jgi:hypothetical protein
MATIGSHFVRPNPGATALERPGSMQNAANQTPPGTLVPFCMWDVQMRTNVWAG